MKKYAILKIGCMMVFCLVYSFPFCAGETGAVGGETDIRAEQLAYERSQMVALHFREAEKFLEEGDFDAAYDEYKAILEIFPDERRAQAGLSRVESLRREFERSEQRRKERELRIQELMEEIEREEALKKERELEAKRERDEIINLRERERNVQRRIDEHMRLGREFYAREMFQDAVNEWEEVLRLTGPADEKYSRARGWIDSAQMMEARKRQIAARLRQSEDEASVRTRVLDVWSYQPPAERWEERLPEERVEVVSPARLRLLERAEREISVDFQNEHIRDVLRELSRLSGINLVLDDTVFPRVPPPALPAVAPVPDVFEEDFFEDELVDEPDVPERPDVPDVGVESPYVTIYLVNIPFIEALDAILRTKGLSYRIEDHLIWVTTEDKIEVDEVVMRTYRPIGDLRDIVITLWEIIPFDRVVIPFELPPEERRAPGPHVPRSSITIDETSGTIFIRHTEAFHRFAADQIRRASDLTMQVTIEAKFIEITLNELRQIGAELGGLEPFTDVFSDDVLTLRDFRFGVSRQMQPEGVFMRYQKFTPTQFELVMQAFQQSNKASVLSSPKITVEDLRPARIDITEQFRWISRYTIEDRTTTVDGESFTQSSWVQQLPPESKYVGVELDITNVLVHGDRRRITIELLPTVTEFVRWMDFAGTPLRSPVFSIRRVDTIVDLNDGETIVLGGLIQADDQESVVTVPVLGDIPLIGTLFRRRQMSGEKKELLIFITARIIDPKGMPLFEY